MVDAFRGEVRKIEFLHQSCVSFGLQRLSLLEENGVFGHGAVGRISCDTGKRGPGPARRSQISAYKRASATRRVTQRAWPIGVKQRRIEICKIGRARRSQKIDRGVQC